MCLAGESTTYIVITSQTNSRSDGIAEQTCSHQFMLDVLHLETFSRPKLVFCNMNIKMLAKHLNT